MIGFILSMSCFIKWSTIIAEMKIGSPAKHPRYAGVIEIPSVNIELPCIEVNVSESSECKLVVDKTDCAAKIWYPSQGVTLGEETPGIWFIADHDYQGFIEIMHCNIGDKVIYTHRDGANQNYIVVDKFTGYVQNGQVCDSEDQSIIENFPEDFILVTCYSPEHEVSQNGTPISRYFVRLKPIEE